MFKNFVVFSVSTFIAFSFPHSAAANPLENYVGAISKSALVREQELSAEDDLSKLHSAASLGRVNLRVVKSAAGKLAYSGKWRGNTRLASTSCYGTAESFAFQHRVLVSGSLARITTSDGGVYLGRTLKKGKEVLAQASGQSSNGFINAAILYSKLRAKGKRLVANVAIGARLTNSSASCEAYWGANAQKS